MPPLLRPAYHILRKSPGNIVSIDLYMPEIHGLPVFPAASLHCSGSGTVRPEYGTSSVPPAFPVLSELRHFPMYPGLLLQLPVQYPEN